MESSQNVFVTSSTAAGRPAFSGGTKWPNTAGNGTWPATFISTVKTHAGS